MNTHKIEEILESEPTTPLFENLEEAVRIIDSISSAIFIQDRTLTPDEYQQIKEATIWIKLNIV